MFTTARLLKTQRNFSAKPLVQHRSFKMSLLLVGMGSVSYVGYCYSEQAKDPKTQKLTNLIFPVCPKLAVSVDIHFVNVMKSICYTIENNNLELLKVILDSYDLEAYKNAIVKKAFEHNNVKILDFLNQRYRYDKFSKDLFQQFLTYAKTPETLSFLLNTFHPYTYMDEADYSFVVNQVVRYGDSFLLENLFKNSILSVDPSVDGKYELFGWSDDTWKEFFNLDKQRNDDTDIEVMKFLYEHCPYKNPNFCLRIAELYIECDTDYSNKLKILIDNYYQDGNFTRIIAPAIVNNKNTQFIKYLIESADNILISKNCTTAEECEKVINYPVLARYAIEYNNMKVFNMVTQHYQLTVEDWKCIALCLHTRDSVRCIQFIASHEPNLDWPKIMENAVRHDDAKLMDHIINTYPEYKWDFDSMFKDAGKSNSHRVVKYLSKMFSTNE
jgi:hypothetical protein